MGVKGLWRLLLPIGRRISVETLHGKVLAVDASIWLTQFLKAMRDPVTGKVAAAAHLIGFFRRLCRLRFHGIKPVFVFDGATPEIKKREVADRRRRREQFAVLTDGSVQRLARKILQDTLQKKQKEMSAATILLPAPGAFVAGFNPGDQDAAATTSYGEAIATDDTVAKNELGSASAVDDDDEIEVIEMTSTAAASRPVVNRDDVNDWDLPLAVAAAEEAKEMEADDEEGESDVEYEDFNDFTSRPERGSNVAGFCVDHISSLPAVQRKDAIEKAKREQRLQSRKEFMPAAANPVDFSNVQLKNFLKSCKLNKDIHAMAKSAAVKDNHGLPGEVMASDRTTRVELIREDEQTNSANEIVGGPKSLMVAKLGSKKRVREPVAVAKFAGDSSDDEVDWGQAVSSSPHGAKITGKRTRLVIDDDDDSNDDESVKEVAVRAANGHVYVRDTIDLAEDDDDDDSGDQGRGGFVASRSGDSKPKAHDTTIEVFSTDDDSDEEEGGGFHNAVGNARAASAASAPVLVDRNIRSEESSDTEEGGFLKDGNVIESAKTQRDAEYAQELEDQALARALQMEEDEIGVRSIQRKVRVGADEQELEHQIHGGALQQSEDDSGIVDAQDAALDSLRDVLVQPIRKAAHELSVREAGASVESSADEDEVDWEEGDTASSNGNAVALQERQPADSSRGVDPAGDFNSAEAEQDWDDGVVAVSGDMARKSIELDDFASDNFESSILGTASLAGQNTSNPMSSETSAALLQAQATAANLTNWAGRAFRRAIQEAGGQDASTLLDASVAGSEQSDIAGKAKHTDATPDDPDSDCDIEQHERTDLAGISLVENAKPAVAAMRTTPQTLEAPAFDASFLTENDAQWTAERNRRERDMDTISDEMIDECKQLLQLFGVPYIEAPTEAEAQCATLEELGLVDGIVTEDSDVFVFGGKTVYKNIFDEQKYAEVYAAADAEREMKLGRNSMVALAMLLGGDYTEGVKGVGIVNAMEILETFDVSDDLKVGLGNFRQWLDGFDPVDVLAVTSTEHSKRSKESAFHIKHRTARTRWVTPQNFPANNVMKAYLDPVVDKSTERFSWGVPDVDNLILFCNKHIGWPPEDTKRYLDPVVQGLQGGLRQTRIDSFMKYEDSIKFADVRSKRLRDVLGLKPEAKSSEGKERGKKKR